MTKGTKDLLVVAVIVIIPVVAVAAHKCGEWLQRLRR